MSRLADINTTDIADAIRMGCEVMGRVFNPEDENRPHFACQLWPETRFGFFWPHSDGHVPGRHLNALLNGEDALGLRIDDDVIDNHARAAFFSMEGPIPLPLTRSSYEGPVENFNPHNMREGFHALHALAAFRDSEPALDLAKRAIAFTFDHWSADDGWDWAYIEGECGVINADKRMLKDFGTMVDSPTFITGLGRAIGPLVKLYRTTGHGRALELAVVLKDKAVGEFFLPDGA